MNLNTKAKDLSRRLHEIAYELGSLAIVASSLFGDHEAAQEFGAAVEAVKAAQATLEETDVVVDAMRDPQDQNYAFSLPE